MPLFNDTIDKVSLNHFDLVVWATGPVLLITLINVFIELTNHCSTCSE